MYEWTKDLETGNKLIDQQHKQLIEAINNLLEACSKGQGKANVDKTLSFLSDYVVKHFADEEQLQLKYSYPEYGDHRKYHNGFKKVVQDIVDQYNNDGATLSLVISVNAKIADWLINHIKKEDVKLAAHIRSME